MAGHSAEIERTSSYIKEWPGETETLRAIP